MTPFDELRATSARPWALLAGIALSALGCDPYDSRLLKEPDPGRQPEAGVMMDGGTGGTGGEEDGGGTCPGVAEQCNRLDDDCDGRVDEDTVAACEQIVVNAQVECAAFGGGARCVLIDCLDGYDSCDGEPANGCERPYCDCNPCEDAGTDDGGI